MYSSDPTFLLIIPALILTIYAQIKVKTTFSKYAKIPNQKGITGKEIAQMMMTSYGIRDVSIKMTQGFLSDYYHPLKKELCLSNEVYNSSSISALGVAAHEAGHAVQHAKAYHPLYIRTLLYPAVNFSSYLAPILIIAGFFFKSFNLLEIGIVFYAVSVVFTLLTLPVEFDASKRAISFLQSNVVLSTGELAGCKKVLSAAALTYVAAAVAAILELLRLILIARSRN